MSRGIGTLQRRILQCLQPTPESERPYICLADLRLSPARYESARRALANLEKRGLIEEVVLWRLALCQRSKRYALPVVAGLIDDSIAKRCDSLRAQRLNAANDKLSVVDAVAQHIKGAA